MGLQQTMSRSCGSGLKQNSNQCLIQRIVIWYYFTWNSLCRTRDSKKILAFTFGLKLPNCTLYELHSKITDFFKPTDLSKKAAFLKGKSNQKTYFRWFKWDNCPYKWDNYQDYLFEKNLSQTYEKYYTGRKPIFLPSGQVGKSFIDNIFRLMN